MANENFYSEPWKKDIEKIFGKGFSASNLSNPMSMLKAASKKWNIPEYSLETGMFPTITKEMMSKADPSRYRPFIQKAMSPIQRSLADLSYFGKGMGGGLQTGRGNMLKSMLQGQLEGAQFGGMRKAAGMASREQNIIRSILTGILRNISSLKG